jgi:hypothetical protein
MEKRLNETENRGKQGKTGGREIDSKRVLKRLDIFVLI